MDLSALALQGLVERAGIDPAQIEDVIWGCVSQVGEQGFNIGRNAALAAGFPEQVPAPRSTASADPRNRHCTSRPPASSRGITTWSWPAVSSRCHVSRCSPTARAARPFGPMMLDRYDGKLVNQGLSAEMIAQKWNLSRQQLDEMAVESHERAARATQDGIFAEEIVPVRGVSADRVFGPDQRRNWQLCRRPSRKTAW